MDALGFVLIGTITGIGGGTTRDLLLGRTVWWTQDPTELLLCVRFSQPAICCGDHLRSSLPDTVRHSAIGPILSKSYSGLNLRSS